MYLTGLGFCLELCNQKTPVQLKTINGSMQKIKLNSVFVFRWAAFVIVPARVVYVNLSGQLYWHISQTILPFSQTTQIEKCLLVLCKHCLQSLYLQERIDSMQSAAQCKPKYHVANLKFCICLVHVYEMKDSHPISSFISKYILFILISQVRLPPNTSDDVDEDPTGNKALWDRGLLNGASQKVKLSSDVYASEDS